jgi:hypothetical protein
MKPMRTAGRVVSVVLVLVAQELGSALPLGGGQVEQNVNATSTFSQLKTTLSRLYPIEYWTVSITADTLHPFVPRFCWEFFRADPEVLGRLGHAIREYKSRVNWALGPPSGSAFCLIAMRQQAQFVGYPPIGQSTDLIATQEAGQQFAPSAEFVDRALADVPFLCSYLEKKLGLKGLPEKSFDPRLLAPSDPPTPDATPDFYEPGMHVARIVFGSSTTKGPESTDKYLLHFSIREAEWREIHREILDSGSLYRDLTRPGTESVFFPLLSRIEETESAYFKREEVEGLRQECLRARVVASDARVIRGLDKLILICNWAHGLNGDISLQAP